MSLETGRKLAHYEIVEPIGKGGMGEVYRALDTKLGRDVAIKVLPEAFAEDEERLRRFQREAKVLASLNHPNIAAIHGLEHDGTTHYLVLELVPGETLAETIARGPIPYDDAIDIAIKIADALEEAHAHGIVHRDLKPANIKITPDGKVKVLDFGLAKAFAEESPDVDSSLSPTITRDATRMGVILGTAAYMSPEQAKGKAVDKRSDIFAFGAVLYEMLTGTKAFPGDGVSEVLAAVIKLEPDWSALPTNVPRRVRALLGRCLRKDAGRRLHDVADARIELEEHDDGTPTAIAPPSRSKWTVTTAFAGVAAVAFVVGWLWPRPRAPLEVERFSMAIDTRFGQGDTDVTFSPDGNDMIISTWDVNGAQLYRRSRGELAATPIEEGRGGFAPFFSPDGAWLGFYTVGGELKKLRWPPQGTPLTLCEVELGPSSGASWGDDDTIVFANSVRLMRVNGAGGVPKQVTAPEDGEAHLMPQRLPDRQTVLFTAATSREDSRAAIASLETGEWRPLITANQARFVPPGHLAYVLDGALWAVKFDPVEGTVSGDAVQITDGVDAFDVSPDGTLAYIDPAPLERKRIVWVDRSGRETPALEASEAFTRPRLSPDGRQLAVEISEEVADDDLWVYDLARQTRTRLTFDQPNTDPVWTPSGDVITHTYGPGNQEDIVSRRANGTGAIETLVGRPSSQNPHSWSPDGRVLAFYERTNDATDRDLWILNVDDGEPEPFLVTAFNERSPSFSPDGRFIAYTSDESGADEIYIQDYPGPGAKITASRGGGREPVWSRDGRELFFRNGGQVWAVDIGEGAPLQVSEPELLFEGPYEGGIGPRGSQTYDVAPDGRFLMVKPDQSAQPGRLIVVLNWTEELKRLVPTTR